MCHEAAVKEQKAMILCIEDRVWPSNLKVEKKTKENHSHDRTVVA